MDISPQNAEWIAGALFIGFYAYKRYNTPSYAGITENRSSTTFQRFLVFFLLYLIVLLIIYWLFGSLLQTSPDVFYKLAWPLLTGAGQPVPPELGGSELKQLTGPIIAALMLTTLLPSLPVLRSFDRWLLSKFWDLGQIPVHVHRQAEKLRRAPLTILPAQRSEITARAEHLGIPPDSLVFKEGSSVEHEWVRLCHLMLQLNNWQEMDSGRYSRFLLENEAEFEELKLEFANISGRLSSYEQRHAKAQTTGEREALEILEDVRRQLLEAARAHVKRVCKFIACGVFAAELSEKARRKSLTQMGFELDAVQVETLTTKQVFTLVMCIAIAFIVISSVQKYIERPEGFQLVPLLFLSLIMTTSYGTAAIAALVPKSAWRFADIEQTGTRSLGAYLLSALLAVVFGLIAIVSLRYTFNAIAGFQPEDNIDRVLVALGWSHPYLLQSVAIGVVTAFLVDSFRSHPGALQSWFRWVDAAGLGLTMLAATVITYCWMEGIGPLTATRDPPFRDSSFDFLFVAKGTAVGLVIGYLVPHWYRQNRLRTPMQWLTRLLNRRAGTVAREAGQLQPGELKEALSAVAAYIATADGRVDAVERDTVRQFLFKLAATQAMDFSVEDAMTRFTDLAGELQFPEKRETDRALEPLRPVVGRALLSDILIYLSLAIGHADGIFGPDERDAVGLIIAELNLKPDNYNLSTKRA